MRSDVELGGSDQRFNLLVGRDLQRDHGQEPQVALTMPLLVGTDGVQKMSQSLGNYVGITEDLDEMFGKLVRVPDDLIAEYRRLTLDFFADCRPRPIAWPASRAVRSTRGRRSAAWRARSSSSTTVPGPARRAEVRFDAVHREREVPEEVEEAEIPTGAIRDEHVWLPRLLAETGLAGSNAEARRLDRAGRRAPRRRADPRPGRRALAGRSAWPGPAGRPAPVRPLARRRRRSHAAATMDAAEQRCLQLTVRRARSVDALTFRAYHSGSARPSPGISPCWVSPHLEN